MILDIAVGIILSVLTSVLFDVALTIEMILLGIAFALLPDIDVLWSHVGKGQWWEKGKRGHREITHYPVFYVPFLLLVWFAWGPIWTFLFACGVFYHLLHDSFDVFGIKWLWPISNEGYALLRSIDGKRKFVEAIDWNAEGERHRGSFRDWAKGTYLKKLAPLEALLLIFAVFILYLYAR